MILRFKGGPGSGHHGHRGRPGKRGGSLPGKGGKRTPPTDSSFTYGQISPDFKKSDVSFIKRAVKNIPQEHLDMVKSIEPHYTADISASGMHYRGHISLEYMRTRGGRDSKLWSKGTVRHEIGHAVMHHMETYGSGASAFRSKVRGVWRRLVDESGSSKREIQQKSKTWRGRPAKGFPTLYAGRNVQELFAESYEMYIRNPQTLLKRSPIMYEFMRDEVFGGVEYIK